MSILAPPGRDLAGARASELARCARMCAYGALDTERADWPPDAARYFARGHMFAEFVCRQLEAKYGRGNVEREREIPWPCGVGHADAYTKPDKMLWEIKSTVSPSATVVEDAIRQLKTYIRFDPEAERGVVYIVNPSRLDREEAFPVKLSEADVEEIDARVAAIGEAIASRGKTLPERICARPADGRKHMCPFVETCFAGWEPPPARDLEAHRATVLGLAAAEQAVRNSTAITNEHKVKRDELRDALRDELEPGVDYEEAGVKLKRVLVKPRRTFQWDRAIKAGAVSEDGPLYDFLSIGQESERWYVAGEGQAAPDDFGDVPF